MSFIDFPYAEKQLLPNGTKTAMTHSIVGKTINEISASVKEDISIVTKVKS